MATREKYQVMVLPTNSEHVVERHFALNASGLIGNPPIFNQVDYLLRGVTLCCVVHSLNRVSFISWQDQIDNYRYYHYDRCVY
jgi:hypothetical protein